MSGIRGVLFDWGDTLFSPPDAGQVIVAAAEERGVRIDRASARALWDELWAAGKTPEELAKGRDLSMAAHREVWTALFRRADAVVPNVASTLYERVLDPIAWIPYPDTAPTLRALRARGIKIGIVSNVPRDLRPIFAAHDLADLVDAFTHSFEVGAEKPDPAIFLRACEALGTKPSETLMVGDHPVADAGSLAAGLRFHLLAPDGAADRPRGLDAVVGIVERSLDRATTRTGRDVAVFVYRDGRLLLMKRARQGIWHIPSGVVETAESFVEAAGRELEEETGLRSASGLIDLSLPQRYPVTDDERNEYPSDVKEVTLHNFAIAAPRRWEPTLNEEHSEYRWSSFAEALALLHWPDTREVLKELVRRLAVVTDQRA